MAVEAPNVPREELKAAIRWKVKDLLEYHVDDATIDVLEIPGDQAPDGKARLMYAVATRNDLVKKRIADFQEARLKLKVIDIPEMAQRNIASRFETVDRSTAMVSFREWGGLLTFTHQGELLLSRRLEVTSEQLSMLDHRTHYLERVATELQRSFENFERRFHRSPIAELLVAPLPEGDVLTGHLAANLYLPVRAIQLQELLEFPAEHAPTVQEQSQYFHLFGAALREEVRAL
jgi:MSHA biogenesis protein MshI